MNNIKKYTQKDRYGNTMSFEFDVPPMGDHPGVPVGTDTVPAWLTPGEFVMNAEATRMFKPQIEAMNNQGQAMQAAQGGTIPQYKAGGGSVTDFLLKDKLTELAQLASTTTDPQARAVIQAQMEKLYNDPSAPSSVATPTTFMPPYTTAEVPQIGEVPPEVAPMPTAEWDEGYPTELQPVPTGINRPTGLGAVSQLVGDAANAMGYESALKDPVEIPAELPMDTGVPAPESTDMSLVPPSATDGMDNESSDIPLPSSDMDTTEVPAMDTTEVPARDTGVTSVEEEGVETGAIDTNYITNVVNDATNGILGTGESKEPTETFAPFLNQETKDRWEASLKKQKEEPEAWDRVTNYFKGALDDPKGFMSKFLGDSVNAIAGSGVIDQGLLAKAAVLYFGSRALGYGHSDSLRWTGKQYVAGLAARDKASAEAKAKLKEYEQQMRMEMYKQGQSNARAQMEEKGRDIRSLREDASRTLDRQIDAARLRLDGMKLDETESNNLLQRAIKLVEIEHEKYNYGYTLADAMSELNPNVNLQASDFEGKPTANVGFNVANVKQRVAQLGGNPETAPKPYYVRSPMRLDNGQELTPGVSYTMYQTSTGLLIPMPDGSMVEIPRGNVIEDKSDFYNTPEITNRFVSLVKGSVPTEVVDEKGNVKRDVLTYNPVELTGALIGHYDDPRRGINGTAFLATNPKAYERLSQTAQVAKNYYQNTGKPVESYGALVRVVDSGFYDVLENDIGKGKLTFKQMDEFVTKPIDAYLNRVNQQRANGGQSPLRPQQLFSNLMEGYSASSSPTATKPEGMPQAQWDDLTAFRLEYEKNIKKTNKQGVPDEYFFIQSYIKSKL